MEINDRDQNNGDVTSIKKIILVVIIKIIINVIIMLMLIIKMIAIIIKNKGEDGGVEGIQWRECH